jgi:uncharacterized protein (DUF4213/DUF364 family)
MSFNQDLIDAIEAACQDNNVPAVSGIHLPPVRADGTPCKKFGAIELADGSCGFFPTHFDNALPALHGAIESVPILGYCALSLAQEFASKNAALCTLGLGACNALSQHHFANTPHPLDLAPDPLVGLHPRSGDHVGMVGFFRPLLDLVPDEASLTIIEQDARFLGEVGRFTVTLDLAQLKDCNPVFITALTLLNGTLDEVLSHCSTSARIAVIGPTASCLPEPLFARGVEAVGSARVVRLTHFREKLLTGQPWAKTVAKYCIHRDQYPGVGHDNAPNAKQ